VTIKLFLGVLQKNLQIGNYSDAETNMARIGSATDKMHKSLSDLLELSRIGRIVNASEEVSMNELVLQALEMLEGQLQSHNITVRVEPGLPRVYCDRARLTEVLANLIDNAAKYMGDQPDPVIQIGKKVNGNETVFFVKDNGIGIDPEYHTKIFGLFEKLDANSEGTGVGLALIRRVTELHGGRMWVESDGVNKGSSFCFTIPDNRLIM